VSSAHSDRTQCPTKSLRSEPDHHKRVYWDNGPSAIKHFRDHHLKSCDENYVCNGIDIKGLIFDYDNDEPEPAAGPLFKDAWDSSDDEPASRVRPRSVSQSPKRTRKKTRTTPELHSRPPLRFGTSYPLLTVEDFLRLKDFSRVSESDLVGHK
jgi:hypothetical protein